MGFGAWAYETYRVILQLTYVLLVILEMPIAFDMSEDCGVAFAVGLITFYFTAATLRTLFKNTRLSVLGSLMYSGQILILPSLLVLQLQVCEAGFDLSFIKPWKFIWRNSTGPFFLLEGFCALITIQAMGRLWRYLARKSESFMMIQILSAAVNITIVLFFLARIYTIPAAIDAVSGTLVGSALTLCAFLGVYGIVSKRGNVIESSLLFTYVVYVIYLTFTDFQASGANAQLFPFHDATSQEAAKRAPKAFADFLNDSLGIRLLPKSLRYSRAGSPEPTATARKFELTTKNLLPPDIIDGYQNVMTYMAAITPQALRTMNKFVASAVYAITPSVLLSLVVRVGVYVAAMRIVPYIRHPKHKRLTPRRNPVLFFIYSYAPCLIISVYAHLLIQHFGGIVHLPKDKKEVPFWGLLDYSNVWMSSRQGWQFWGWVNVFTTLIIYGLELMLSDDSVDA